MNTLFNQADVAGIIGRINKLGPDSQKQWGKMNVSQMLAHCNVSLETAMGHNVIKPVFFIGRIIGSLLKPKALGEKPFGRNSPTDKSYIFSGQLDFEAQKTKIIRSINDFSEGGPTKATKHPHPFFGHMDPEQWDVFQWKHLDHHLRQFGV